MRSLRIALPAAFLLARTAFCQAPPEMPKPAPELKRLAYLLGNWKSEGDMKPSPFGPGGKFTGTDRNEWFPGNFFLVMHSDSKTPMGDMKSVAIFGYNTDEKVYTFHSIDSMGADETSKGTVEGDTWTWLGESKAGGKTMKGRFIMKEVSPAMFTYSFESSADGSSWTKIMEGKATKVK
jgi:Protein of unknown function (DUF1579)